nr:Uma2 family endonuclease [Allorhizocola rhizosphaerae]
MVHADADTDADLTTYPPQAVVLTVEVVSPDSQERDRKRKPHLYAEAGIKHFWLVENTGGGKMAVYVYELDPIARRYTMTGIYHNTLKLNAPFDIDIDLTEIDRL